MKNEENKKLMKEFDCAPGGHFLCDFKVPLLTTLHRLLDILEKLWMVNDVAGLNL